MALTIDELEIQIQADAKKASNGIDSLIKSMERLNSILGKTNGISSSLSKISEGFKSLGELSNLDLSAPIQQIQRIKDLTTALSGKNTKKFAENIIKNNNHNADYELCNYCIAVHKRNKNKHHKSFNNV